MSSLFDFLSGTCGRSYRSLLSRAVKIGAPTTGMVGLAADLGTPVATFVPWLAVAAAFVTGTAGLVWFGGYRRKLSRALADGRITQSEIEHATEHNVWSVGFAFGLVSTVVLGSLMGAQQLAAEQDKGVLATVLPSLERLQATVLSIDKNVLAAKEATVRVEVKTDAVLEKLEDMNASFEKAAKGGVIIANPSTPAEHYHNARLFEVKSDYAGARRSYNAYLASGVEFIDPYLAYVDLLKVQDGSEGAREVVEAMRKSNRTLSLEAAASLLLPKPQRVSALRHVLESNPEFSPAAFLLSREFSSDKLGEQTLAEKREEIELLKRFQALDKAGKFQRYVMDKKLSQNWLEATDARLAKFADISSAAIAPPVALTLHRIMADEWSLRLAFAEENIKSIEYRLDGRGDFRSTGFSRISEPAVPHNSIYKEGLIRSGHKILEVRYTDFKGQLNGPYMLQINAENYKNFGVDRYFGTTERDFRKDPPLDPLQNNRPATGQTGTPATTSGGNVIFKHAGLAEAPEQFMTSTEATIVGKVVRDKDPGGWKYELQAEGKTPIRIQYEGSDSFSKVLVSLEEKEQVVSVSGVVGTFRGGYMAFDTSKPIVIAKGN